MIALSRLTTASLKVSSVARSISPAPTVIWVLLVCRARPMCVSLRLFLSDRVDSSGCLSSRNISSFSDASQAAQLPHGVAVGDANRQLSHWIVNRSRARAQSGCTERGTQLVAYSSSTCSASTWALALGVPHHHLCFFLSVLDSLDPGVNPGPSESVTPEKHNNMLRVSCSLVGVTKSLVAKRANDSNTRHIFHSVLFNSRSRPQIVSTVMCRLSMWCDDVCCGNTVVGSRTMES